MFDFTFDYKDKRSITINGISEVTYYSSMFDTVVPEEEILTHRFPVNVDLQLRGKDCNYSISHDGLLKISIMRGAS